MNMWFALQNMRIDDDFRQLAWSEFVGGYGVLDFGTTEEELFFEYHRLRWLMLNLTTKNPLRTMNALKALGGFARPYGARRGRLLL